MFITLLDFREGAALSHRSAISWNKAKTVNLVATRKGQKSDGTLRNWVSATKGKNEPFNTNPNNGRS
jgi:hypothetical protein